LYFWSQCYYNFSQTQFKNVVICYIISCKHHHYSTLHINTVRSYVLNLNENCSCEMSVLTSFLVSSVPFSFYFFLEKYQNLLCCVVTLILLLLAVVLILVMRSVISNNLYIYLFKSLPLHKPSSDNQDDTDHRGFLIKHFLLIPRIGIKAQTQPGIAI
jgi:hypothetical protein